MLGISGRQERALVVVEPPSDFGRVRVLKIDDGIFVAIEEAGSPGLRSPMGHACKAELRGGIEFFPVKAVEKSGGGGPIKTSVVEAEPDAGHVLEMAPFGFFLPWQSRDKAFQGGGTRKRSQVESLDAWTVESLEGGHTRDCQRNRPKKEPPGRTGRLPKNAKLRQLLLVDHLLDEVSDDRQLEHFVAVSLVHKKYPGREDSQPKDGEDGQSHEAKKRYVSDDKIDDPQSNPNGNDAYIERNRLRGMELNEWALVNKQENQARNPSKNIGNQSS